MGDFRVLVGQEKFREAVVETEDGPELKLLCNKQANCGYRDYFSGACEPVTQFGELFECFYKSKREKIIERAEEIAQNLGDENERVSVQARVEEDT